MNEKSTSKVSKNKIDKAKQVQEQDEAIDYSDIPATTQEFWEDAEVFMPQHKVHLSIRLDDEIVDFFKKKGPGYQSKMNAVLKAYVYAHSKKHYKKRSE